MKAVFSLCTKFQDAQNAHGGFPDAEAFGCSCILSVLLAKRHFGQLVLHTDARGARLLEHLQLPFDEVALVFDDFAYPQQLWMASKLETYHRQAEPFVHLDLDAYLWGPLPARLLGAGLLAQSSEEDFGCYDRVLAYFIQNAGYIPDFVREHVAKYGLKVRALNAGVYGGYDLATIHACAEAALTTIHHSANRPMFAALAAQHGEGYGLFHDFTILLEQYFASVYCHERGIAVGYVLSDQEPPYFTHLLSSAKRHPDNVRNLKQRVAQDYPAYHCLTYSLVA